MFFLALFLFTLIACALIIVVVQNLATQVHLFLFAWQLPTLPVGLILLGAFILGALLLYIISALFALRDLREKRQLRKRVEVLEQQLREQAVPITPVAQAAQSLPMPTNNNHIGA